MTVVFPSSHSPMSTSIGEHPSAPGTPPPVVEASVVNDENHGFFSGDERPRKSSNFHHSPDKPSIAQPTNRKPKAIEAHAVVRDDSICKDFFGRHLRAAPTSFCVCKEMSAYVDEICAAGTSEPKMYKPTASLLTAISKEVYSAFQLLILKIQHRLTAINYRVSRQPAGRCAQEASSYPQQKTGAPHVYRPSLFGTCPLPYWPPLRCYGCT